MQSQLCRQYWIVRGRNEIRRICRYCVRCMKFRAKTIEQMMAPLPAIRLRPSRPFTCTGVDFAGPFLIKASSLRGIRTFKGYVALFVCMVVKAIHIEIVSDLTSVAFLAAFRRFVARRGLCRIMCIDNGKNFEGASAELKLLFSETSAFSHEVAAQLAKDCVEWRFNCPRAPHFGGLWEANIKSFKAHFVRTIGDKKFSFEEFSTVATMIEACLNSRPLATMNNCEEDLAALTPGHFLIGSALISPPEPFDDTDINKSYLSRWQRLVVMRNYFWKRWRREFLHELQQRAKWLEPNRELQVGDEFQDELASPTKWPLARVTHLFPGNDNLDRVAEIQTANGTYKRALKRLVRLPVNEKASIHFAQIRALTMGENELVDE